MEQFETSVSSANNVVSLASKNKHLDLKAILKQTPELRGFFRYVHRYELREKALELIERRLYLSR